VIEQRPVAARTRRGRPPASLQPSASAAARLGAELRAHRQAIDLTLAALSDRVGYSGQHISQVEHGHTMATEVFLRACEAELRAGGALMRLLPDVIGEQARLRSARVAARRGDTNGDQEDEMDPTSRRGLAQDGAAATLSLAVIASPTRAHEVDPALPHHWDCLLATSARMTPLTAP
jgi:transcriptional regulator with XRE-family HTH domain